MDFTRRKVYHEITTEYQKPLPSKEPKLPKWNVHFIVWVVNNILLKEYPEHLYRIWLYKVFDIKVAIWEEKKVKEDHAKRELVVDVKHFENLFY